MFQKPFKIKSQSLVKKSEKKKIHEELLQSNPSLPSETLNDLLPLKDDVNILKLTTYSQDNVTVYSHKKNPVFFVVDKLVLPTVYALWKHPELAVSFKTNAFVFSKLKGGADLMLPGVVVPKSGFPPFTKGQCCSVSLLGSKASVAVGRTSLDNSSLVRDNLKTGKLVNVLHILGDCLWELGDKTLPPQIDDDDDDEEDAATVAAAAAVDDEIIKTDGACHGNDANDDHTKPRLDIETCNKPVNKNELNDGVVDKDDDKDVVGDGPFNNLIVSDIGGNISTSVAIGDDLKDGAGDDGKCDGSSNHGDDNVEDDEDNEDGDEAGDDDDPDIPESMDDLLELCFLYAMKLNGRRIQLPILTNVFYSNYVIPCCPKGRSLEVKKSTYRKLSTFLMLMQQDGLIVVEEVSKGVESITSLVLDHEKLKNFTIPSWDLNERKEDENTSIDPSIDYSPPEITSVYLITSPVLPVLNTVVDKKFKKGDEVTMAELRNCITKYVKDNELHEGRNVQLDDKLSALVLYKNEYTPVLPWSELIDRITEKMTIAHRVVFPNQPPIIRKGPPEKIVFDVKQKASNKKVTLVKNLELYGINVEQLASKIQKAISCSVTLLTSGDKNNVTNPVMQAQGNQINYIKDLLIDKYKLSASHMEGLSKAPKKKK